MGTSAERVINIGARERRKRLTVGIVALCVGVIIAVLLVVVRAPLVWRLPPFLPFFVGALGFFPARDKTWVELAPRGLRDPDTGPPENSAATEAPQPRRPARAW